MSDLTSVVSVVANILASHMWSASPDPAVRRMSAHTQHDYDAECAICRGGIDAIAQVAAAVAYPLIAAEVLRAEAARTETYVQFRVGGRFGQQQHVHGGISRDALRRRAAEYEQDAKDKDTTATGDER